MSASTPIAEVLSALAAILGRLHHRWYLFGAQAVLLWGRPRTSLDIDVTVELEPEAAPGLIDRLDEAGFELRIRSEVEAFVRRTRVLPFLHRASGIPVDIVLGGPGLEELFLERAIVVRLGGADIPVISPEDLVVTKILAGRPKDLEDVRGVLAERLGTLDLAGIRSTLAAVEAALGQSDLLPAFEAELARAEGS